MMMMAAAALRKQFTLVGVNLWQTGIRSLFNFYIYRSELDRDTAWANIREELFPLFKTIDHDPEEWEFQFVRAILYEEHNITLEEAVRFYDLYPNSTPLLDAMRNCIAKLKED